MRNLIHGLAGGLVSSVLLSIALPIAAQANSLGAPAPTYESVPSHTTGNLPCFMQVSSGRSIDLGPLCPTARPSNLLASIAPDMTAEAFVTGYCLAKRMGASPEEAVSAGLALLQGYEEQKFGDDVQTNSAARIVGSNPHDTLAREAMVHATSTCP